MARRSRPAAALMLLGLVGCAARPPAPPAPPPPQARVPESVETRYRRIVAERERDLGPRNPDVATGQHDLGRFLVAQHRPADAIAPLEQALSIREEAWGLDDPQLLETIFDLGDANLAAGRCLEAEALFRRAITIADANDRSDGLEAGRGYNALGQAVACQGDLVDADRVFVRAAKITEHAGAGHSVLMADILTSRAALARQNGHERQAAGFEARATAIRHRLGLPSPPP